MALCANGVFYSNHSYFKTFASNSEDVGAAKIAMANKFLDQAEKMLPVEFTNEMELIDSLRSMLMIVDVNVCLGNSQAASVANGFNLFNFSENAIIN